jgi:hypothetical protein
MAALSMTTPMGEGAESGRADGIALWRLYLLRFGYLLGAVGMGNIMVPAFLHHGPWTSAQGVKNSMLLALAGLCVLGLRYPLKMLPLLFWEIAWKVSWLAFIAFPAWQNGTMNADMRDNLFPISAVVIFLVLMPWDYVWRNYVAAKSERWR